MSTSILSEPSLFELKNGSKSSEKTDEDILQMPLLEYLKWCEEQSGTVYSDNIPEELSKMTLEEYHDSLISSPMHYAVADCPDTESEEDGERMHQQSGVPLKVSETEKVDTFSKQKLELNVDVPRASKSIVQANGKKKNAKKGKKKKKQLIQGERQPYFLCGFPCCCYSSTDQTEVAIHRKKMNHQSN